MNVLYFRHSTKMYTCIISFNSILKENCYSSLIKRTDIFPSNKVRRMLMPTHSQIERTRHTLWDRLTANWDTLVRWSDWDLASLAPKSRLSEEAWEETGSKKQGAGECRSHLLFQILPENGHGCGQRWRSVSAGRRKAIVTVTWLLHIIRTLDSRTP